MPPGVVSWVKFKSHISHICYMNIPIIGFNFLAVVMWESGGLVNQAPFVKFWEGNC